MQGFSDIPPKKSIGSIVREMAVRSAKGIRTLNANQWQKIAFTLAGLIIISIGFAYLSRFILTHIDLPLDEYMSVSLVAVFFVFLIANLVIFTPLPIAMTVLVTAALLWNPVLVGVAAGVGSSLGELSGYFAGLLGRQVLVRGNFMGNFSHRFGTDRLSQDVRRYGPLAIGILAAQPVLPFDIGGIIAGSIKMPLPIFLLATLIGKTVKYIIVAYLAGLLVHVPFI